MNSQSIKKVPIKPFFFVCVCKTCVYIHPSHSVRARGIWTVHGMVRLPASSSIFFSCRSWNIWETSVADSAWQEHDLLEFDVQASKSKPLLQRPRNCDITLCSEKGPIREFVFQCFGWLFIFFKLQIAPEYHVFFFSVNKSLNDSSLRRPLTILPFPRNSLDGILATKLSHWSFREVWAKMSRCD